MKKLSTKEIREVFLDFFAKHSHHFLKSASIIPNNDPTLLYINSGMAPLKSYFLGEKTPPSKLLCNVQPCIRTNDIEEVGDRHHLTFFEMLGSWSIGGYYKEGAIQLAYDLLVNHFGYHPDMLYATVYKGDEELNIPPDTESIEIWRQVGLAEDHIVPLGKDNFWGPAGTTGPCGPCTEVFFDTGDKYGPKYYPGGHFDDVNRYIEIWNAGVFMEMNKMADGTFEPLPLKSVDTGSGLERMYLALNNCETLYDVDVVKPVYELTKKLFSAPGITETDLRVVTDHMRSSTFILSEGVRPSREGRGYIVRRLIRKCVTVAVRAKVGPQLLTQLCDEVVNQLQEFYPHLNKERENIRNAFSREISDFEPVITNGLTLLEDALENLSGNKLDAQVAFKLVTSDGVPFEIVNEYAKSHNVAINKDEFDKLYREHQEISRNTGAGEEQAGMLDLNTIANQLNGLEDTCFVGYELLKTKGHVVRLIARNGVVDQVVAGEDVVIVTDQTSFYAESGGQVGDRGRIQGNEVVANISDVKKIAGIHLHIANVEKGAINLGDEVEMCVDEDVRSRVKKNHSATHLLQSALISVLGSHVMQKGSLVNDEKLRFDYQHDSALTAQQIHAVEDTVNGFIWSSTVSAINEENYQQAIDSGVTALFGEKYGNRVRVVRFGEVSSELCGGTHVGNTGEIGLFKILSESSIARGIRRIEAVTGSNAFMMLSNAYDVLADVQRNVGIKPDKLVTQIKELKKAAKYAKSAVSATTVSFSKYEVLESSLGLKGAFIEAHLERQELLATGEDVLSKRGLDVVFLFAPGEKKHIGIVLVNKSKGDKVVAKELLMKWIEPFSGKGGGKKTMAQGGFSGEVDSVDVLASAKEVFL